MLTAALIVLAAALAVGWLVWEFTTAPHMNFDEHTATAMALLQPDHPCLPDDTPLADAVQAWLREHTPPTTHERENPR